MLKMLMHYEKEEIKRPEDSMGEKSKDENHDAQEGSLSMESSDVCEVGGCLKL